jgi:uncharacterized protein
MPYTMGPMPLLIDCYNVLGADLPSNLAGMDEARLCRELARRLPAGQRAVVVCDGVRKPGGAAASPDPNVELVYAGRGRSADAEIEARIAADSAPRRLTVVSSDRSIQRAAKRRRARTMDSAELIVQLARPARGPSPSAGEPGAKFEPLEMSAQEVARWARAFGVSLDEEDEDSQ